MNLKQQLDADLKTALLAGDKTTAMTLRGLKAAILNEEVSQGSRDTGLADEAIITLLQKEAKKRQESAELFEKGGNSAKAEDELTEKALIEKYLPAQMSDEDLMSV